MIIPLDCLFIPALFGAKGKNTVTADVSAWLEWVRRQRIVLAMSGAVVYTRLGEAVELAEMMRRLLARVDKTGQHERLELSNGRKANLFPGDEIVLC